MNIFASNLLAKREERRFTQAHMAILSGMSQPNYSDIERGKTKPSIDQLKRFSEILDVSVDALLSDKKQSPRPSYTTTANVPDLEPSALLKRIEDKDKYIKSLEDQLSRLRNNET